MGTQALQERTRNITDDSAGRLTNYVDRTAGGVVTSTVGYDEAGQLVAYNGPAGTFTFNYDTNGNRRSTVRNGVTQTLTYAADSNRLISSPRGNYTYVAGSPLSKADPRGLDNPGMGLYGPLWTKDECSEACESAPNGIPSCGIVAAGACAGIGYDYGWYAGLLAGTIGGGVCSILVRIKCNKQCGL